MRDMRASGLCPLPCPRSLAPPRVESYVVRELCIRIPPLVSIACRNTVIQGVVDFPQETSRACPKRPSACTPLPTPEAAVTHSLVPGPLSRFGRLRRPPPVLRVPEGSESPLEARRIQEKHQPCVRALLTLAVFPPARRLFFYFLRHFLSRPAHLIIPLLSFHRASRASSISISCCMVAVCPSLSLRRGLHIPPSVLSNARCPERASRNCWPSLATRS